MLTSKWRPVRKSHPCPICGRPDWCQVSTDGRICICQRVQSTKRTKSGGNIHRLDDSRGTAPSAPTLTRSLLAAAPAPAPLACDLTAIDFEILAAQCRSACSPKRLERLARELGISIESLEKLEAGWHPELRAWTFPMKDAGGKVIGIRTRQSDGRKRAIRGSRAGLFLPPALRLDRLVITEGPSDTGAAFDLSLNAAGRPSCSGAVDLVLGLIQRHQFARLIIFSQRDEAHRRPDGGIYYPAQDGAEVLAHAARGLVEDVRIIMPPAHAGDKDVRDWLRRGGSRAEVDRLIEEAAPRRMSVSVCVRRKGGRPCHRKLI